jgi:hypothetical protein
LAIKIRIISLADGSIPEYSLREDTDSND